MPHWPRSIAAFAAVAVVSVVSVAQACGGGSGPDSPPAPTGTPTPTSTPTPTPIDPLAVLERAGKAMDGVSSFEFLLDHESGGTVLMPNLVIREIEGYVVRPDKLSIDFRGRFGNFPIKGRLISVGSVTYMTNPLTDAWEVVPQSVSPVGFFNEIAGMLSQVTQTSAARDGPDVHRITGRLPAEALKPLVGTTVTGVTIAVELVVRGSDFYLLEATFQGRVNEAEDADTVRVITLSRFNEPFTIEPPP